MGLPWLFSVVDFSIKSHDWFKKKKKNKTIDSIVDILVFSRQ